MALHSPPRPLALWPCPARPCPSGCAPQAVPRRPRPTGRALQAVPRRSVPRRPTSQALAKPSPPELLQGPALTALPSLLCSIVHCTDFTAPPPYTTGYSTDCKQSLVIYSADFHMCTCTHCHCLEHITTLVMYSAHHRLAFHSLSDQSIHSSHLLTSLPVLLVHTAQGPLAGPTYPRSPIITPLPSGPLDLQPSAHLASGPLGLRPTRPVAHLPSAHLATGPLGLLPNWPLPTWPAATWPSATLILLFDVLRWPRRPSSSSF